MKAIALLFLLFGGGSSGRFSRSRIAAVLLPSRASFRMLLCAFFFGMAFFPDLPLPHATLARRAPATALRSAIEQCWPMMWSVSRNFRISTIARISRLPQHVKSAVEVSPGPDPKPVTSPKELSVRAQPGRLRRSGGERLVQSSALLAEVREKSC